MKQCMMGLAVGFVTLLSGQAYGQDVLKTGGESQGQSQSTKGKSPIPPKGPTELKWSENIQWKTWTDARFESAQSGKGICLVLYTNWCPRCRDLLPVFDDPRVLEAAKHVVMVKQNQDHRPEWLQQYAETGGYVPRILFFGSDGELRGEITSGSQRYPYYYTARGIKALVESMRKVAGQ